MTEDKDIVLKGIIEILSRGQGEPIIIIIIIIIIGIVWDSREC